ncbi:MAG: hypothetical protein QXW47_02255 [Candidatus Jordarchaeales archaeon]|nr:hypothetical protein [Candidatus Jordarchaeia archaeon]
MESEEKGLGKFTETLLEWTGWGGLAAAAITVLLVATLGSVHLDNEAAAIIIMSLFLGITAWGTGKLIKEREEERRKYFRIWIALVFLGAVLLILAILFVPT